MSFVQGWQIGILAAVAIAAALNSRDWRMLALCCAFLCVNAVFDSMLPPAAELLQLWFPVMALAEVLIVIAAWSLKASASSVIARLSIYAAAVHLATGAVYFRGMTPLYTAYPDLIRIAEGCQAAALIIFSRPILAYARKAIPLRTEKEETWMHRATRKLLSH